MPENELIRESSPYLLSHAHNPVNWFPWGEKALNKAREENKLMIISIGYSACHWCHVMEEESFEDLEIAQIMNQFFICIKVDREERPDIDQIYLDAVQIMTGHGGWPLNCFTLPNQEPIYGGTYFRKEDWKNILLNLANYWKKNPVEAEDYAKNLSRELQDKIIPWVENQEFPNPQSLYQAWSPYLDSMDGGFSGAPKFPLPNSWLFLLKLLPSLEPGNTSESIKFIRLTLDRMKDGGIYDQVGGGFARYSTDQHWFAPHFEKMLYDNAQLLSLYSMSFLAFKNPEYKKVVYETLNFLLRDLHSPEGGFYSALDADSEGEEGKYYVWSQSELKNLLGSFEPSFSLYFHVQPNGNWEGSNILYKRPTSPPIFTKLGMTQEEFEAEMLRCTHTLLTHRYTRIPPALDDKILCSWNALLIKGFCDAYKAFQDQKFLESALQITEFLYKNMVEADQVKRTYKLEKSRISGFLDDYSFLADALISLYQVSFNPEWIYKSQNLVHLILQYFNDPQSHLFYYTDIRETSLIARKKEIHDSVIPSSNSVLAHVFYKLGHYLYRDDYLEKARNMVLEVNPKILHYAPSYFNWSTLSLEMHQGSMEICILGEKAEIWRKKLELEFIPLKILSGWDLVNQTGKILPVIEDKLKGSFQEMGNKSRVYICKNRVCGLPHENLEEAIKEIQQGLL